MCDVDTRCYSRYIFKINLMVVSEKPTSSIEDWLHTLNAIRVSVCTRNGLISLYRLLI